jgi:transposase
VLQKAELSAQADSENNLGVSGLLMETGISYNKQRLHKVGYFAELMMTNEEVHESIRPLLKLSRDMISRSQKLDYALVSSLQRDPVLKERLSRLRTVPGVGPITALTWALEIGDYTRFWSIKQAISYCGLCGDEKSSADKVMRMPTSKQRNKHIQRVLIEAAKLAPSESHQLALTHDERTGAGKSEPRHVGGCQEDGLLHARCWAQAAGLRACRGI